MTEQIEQSPKQNPKTLFSAILRSCTDFKFYKEIFPQSFGKTLRYLLVLALFVTLVLGVRYGIFLNKASKQGLQWIQENVPYIEITDGVVSADVEQPYIIEDKDFVAIIDTTGETNEIDSRYETGVLLVKNKLIFKQSDVRTQEFDLSKIESFQLDENTLKKWRKLFVTIVIPFMIVMVVVQFIIVKIIQVLIAGLAVLVFKPQLKYNNILNVCMYALTPVTLLALIVMLIIPRPLLLFSIVYLGMYIAFIIGGIRQVLLEI